MSAPAILHRSARPRARASQDRVSPMGIGVALVGLLSIACNDAYSQRRIERRWGHLNETANSIIKRRGRRHTPPERETEDTLKKWWEHDTGDSIAGSP